MRRTLVLLALLFGLSCGVALAQTSVTVTLGKPRQMIKPLATGGVNHGVYMQVVDALEDIAALELTSLRFPPGNIADEQPLDVALVSAFEAQWRLLGEPPVLVALNLFSGTPEAGAEAARLLLDRGVEVLAWEIGNEPDLYGPNRGDPSWTPEKYCRQFRAFKATLAPIDSSIPLAGPAVSGGSGAEAYLREVLRLCGDAIDILSWHIYPTDGSASDEDALDSSSRVSETIRRYRDWTRDPEYNPLGSERDIQLAVTEFGLSWRSQTYRHLSDIVAALWLADALGRMATEGLELSHYFALQGTGGHGLLDATGWKRPTYYVFELLKDFSGMVLEASSSRESLRAYAARDDEALRVLLVNLSSEAASVTLIGFSATGLSGEISLKTLSEAGIDPFSDEPAYTVTQQEASDPVSVPGRALVALELSAP